MAEQPPKPDKHRVPVLFTPEEAQELDNWQFRHRHRTRTAAIKALMRLGYEASETPAKSPRSASSPRTAAGQG
jgi:Holliday junction resolvasome RuvABC DNA-binding subunit